MIARILETSQKIPKPTTTLPRLGVILGKSVCPDSIRDMSANGEAEIVAISDPRGRFSPMKSLFPKARIFHDVENLLGMDLDGVVIDGGIGTLALAEKLLEQGSSLYLSKIPFGNSEGLRRIIRTARRVNRLVWADLSHRHTTGAEQIRLLLRKGDLGNLFGADFVFYNLEDCLNENAGALLDDGVLLLDLLLWCLDFPCIKEVSSRLHRVGEESSAASADFITARLILSTGASVQVSCSSRLPAGCEPIISGAFYGTKGSAGFRNVDGSRTEFLVTHCHHGRTEMVPQKRKYESCSSQWVRRLRYQSGYDSEIEQLISLTAALEQIYGR